MKVFGQSGCIRDTEVVFGQKWLYSGKNGLIREKVVVFEQSGCIRAKVVVFGQKWMFSGKFVAFGQK